MHQKTLLGMSLTDEYDDVGIEQADTNSTWPPSCPVLLPSKAPSFEQCEGLEGEMRRNSTAGVHGCSLRCVEKLGLTDSSLLTIRQSSYRLDR